MKQSAGLKININDESEKMLLKEVNQTEEFISQVFTPYFKDIFTDLVEKSDAGNNRICKSAFVGYSRLPGIIADRLFALMEPNDKGQVA